MVTIVQKYQFKALKNHDTAMFSRVLSINYIRVVDVDHKRGLTSSPAASYNGNLLSHEGCHHPIF